MNKYLDSLYWKNKRPIKTTFPSGALLSGTAAIKGNNTYPNLHGQMQFYYYRKGTLISGEFWGLPYDSSPCASNIYGVHIHESGNCDNTDHDHFEKARGHYNPTNCPHPSHAGDLPPLFSNEGYAWFSFYTDKFTVNEIIGRSVIIHSQPDDFTSQPSGNSGDRVACGIIEKI